MRRPAAPAGFSTRLSERPSKKPLLSRLFVVYITMLGDNRNSRIYAQHRFGCEINIVTNERYRNPCPVASGDIYPPPRM